MPMMSRCILSMRNHGGEALRTSDAFCGCSWYNTWAAQIGGDFIGKAHLRRATRGPMPLLRRVMRTDWGSHERLCSAPTALARTLPSPVPSSASNPGMAAQSRAACLPLPCAHFSMTLSSQLSGRTFTQMLNAVLPGQLICIFSGKGKQHTKCVLKMGMVFTECMATSA